MTEPAHRGEGPTAPRVVPAWFMAVVTLPILVGLVWFGRGFLIPLVLAALLFILNMVLIDRLNALEIGGRKIPRWLAYVVATALIFGLLVGLGYSLSNQVDALGSAAPKYAERLVDLKARAEGILGPENVAAIETALRNADLEGLIAEFAASAFEVVGDIGLILLYVAFMLAERGAFAEKLPRLSRSPEQARRVRAILDEISEGVRQYMWINAATSAMSATLAYIVFRLVGLDFASSLAISVFFLNFIPNIGSILAVVLPTLVALLQFDTLVPALIIVVAYGGGDAIIGNIVQPRMQGKSLNLSTFVVMVALTFWGMMWGGVGAFIAVPLTVVIMIVCAQVPGLQPYARLLSSDGILPGERPAASVAGPDDTATGGSAPAAGGDAGNPPTDGTEADAEVAALKRELLDLRKERRHGKGGKRAGKADRGGS